MTLSKSQLLFFLQNYYPKDSSLWLSRSTLESFRHYQQQQKKVPLPSSSQLPQEPPPTPQKKILPSQPKASTPLSSSIPHLPSSPPPTPIATLSTTEKIPAQPHIPIITSISSFNIEKQPKPLLENFEDIENWWNLQFPQKKLRAQVYTETHYAHDVTNSYDTITSNAITTIITSLPHEYRFYLSLKKALLAYRVPCQLVSSDVVLSNYQQHQSFLSTTYPIVIMPKSLLNNLPQTLISSYRLENDHHYLGNTPLLLIDPLESFQNNPMEKKKLWYSLNKILNFSPAL